MDLLAASFRDAFGFTKEVTLNTPFSGGFITNAHYWHKGIPWVQIEINRMLYERGDLSSPGNSAPDGQQVAEVRDRCWEALREFLERLGEQGRTIPPAGI
jgi:formiminoglutamase